MYFRTALIAAILVLVDEAAPPLKRWDICEETLIQVEVCIDLSGED